MTNYANGKIYKIQGTDPADKCYVGSTTTTKQYLSQRMVKHVGNYKRWKAGKPENRITSFEIFDKYGIENCTIVLLENYVAKSKDELRAREQHHINILDCVNRNAAIVDHADPEKMKHKKREERIRNAETYKAWRLAHPVSPVDKHAEYERNKAKYKAYRQIEIQCETCNCTIRKCNRSEHVKTAKHLANLNNKA